MTKDINLKQIEQKAHRTFRQDGLSIFFAGISLGIIAIFFVDIRHGWVFALGITLAISVPQLLRRQFVYPRVGYAKFLQRSSIARHVLAITLAIICLALFYALGKVARFNWLMPVYVAIIFSAAAFIAARKYGSAIYYVVTLACLTSGLIGLTCTLSGYHPGYVTAFQLWGLAALLIVAGLFQFVRFLTKYPRPTTEGRNG